jgi:hypothetical protein
MLTFVCYQTPGGELCIEDVDNLKKWTPQAVTSVADNLTPQGYKDAYYVAQRYASRFPKLLSPLYSPHRFQVSASNVTL